MMLNEIKSLCCKILYFKIPNFKLLEAITQKLILVIEPNYTGTFMVNTLHRLFLSEEQLKELDCRGIHFRCVTH